MWQGGLEVFEKQDWQLSASSGRAAPLPRAPAGTPQGRPYACALARAAEAASSPGADLRAPIHGDKRAVGCPAFHSSRLSLCNAL